MDRLTALAVFCSAAERTSFVAASRQLGLSTSSVSKNIKELEAHLGTRLFQRTTRRVTLTEAGSVYYERVRRVLDELEEADGAVGALHGEARGRLRVSAPVTLSLLTITQQIPVFLRRHPELSLDLHLDDRRVDLVRDGFDIALRGSDRLEDSILVARRLTTLTHVLCASPAYVEEHGAPEHPRALAEHCCVQFSLSDHADRWTFRKGKEAVPVAIDGVYRVSSSLAVRDALLAGFGLSLVPRRYVADDLREGRLVELLAGWSSDRTTIYAVYPSRQFLVPKVRVFLDFLVEQLGGGEAARATC